MTDRTALLSRLGNEAQTNVMRRVRQTLRSEETRVLQARSKVSVSEALRLWSTRHKNTAITGQELHGIELFLGRLRSLAPQRKLEQVGLIGKGTAANLFFAGNPTRQFIGAVVVDVEDGKSTA